jgi:hypothetical protein
VLDRDHSEDAVHGQQPLAFYNHHDRRTCYLPLFIFDGLSGALVTAVLRPGKRPTGAENAMIMARVQKLMRCHFPDTHSCSIPCDYSTARCYPLLMARAVLEDLRNRHA